LFDDVPGLEGQTLASRRPLVVRSRDGLDLRCDVYLPAGADANDDGIPDRPLPTVVYVHGGPWTGYEWNLWLVNRNFQLLANRGYAVIRAGFRGEVGYGMRYVDAGDRAWGTTMHRDLVDIAEQAATLGIAARGRIAIWGWSYGGYAVATALALAPDTFACGLAMYGVYDLEAMLRVPFTANPFWRARAGDVDSPADLARIREQSPLTHVDAIRNPLLVSHGALDDRVPIAQSDTLVAALEKRGRPVTYLVFPDEGHDYARPESWQAFWAVGEAFLHEQLGGAAEPMGDEESRVRVEVRAGAGRVAAWRSAGRPGAKDGG
ncbi:MAG TPA: prolyl oligopeptidase family serine peptidase, partial [Candidatus Krumholzibacteria bacterium]